MLKLADSTAEHDWSGAMIELNMSYTTLRDYQWKRLLEALWQYTGITGPFEVRYLPHQALPLTTDIRIPDPTATVNQHGAFEITPNVKVGFELLATRSLFECISVLIPLTMFESVVNTKDDPHLLEIETALRELAIHLFKVSRFDLAVFGVNRECQLLAEMLLETQTRTAFLKQGNFLAQDETLMALHTDPQKYEAILPFLRWCPRLE